MLDGGHLRRCARTAGREGAGVALGPVALVQKDDFCADLQNLMPAAGLEACKPVPTPTVHGTQSPNVQGQRHRRSLLAQSGRGDAARPLLTAGGAKTVSGKTFARKQTGTQCFDQFVISMDGKAVLDVSTLDGKTHAKLDGKVLVQSGKLKAGDVEVHFAEDGYPCQGRRSRRPHLPV